MSTGVGQRVEERVALPGGEVVLLRPPDFEELLTEEAFEREELLPYWAHLWASSVALARAVANRDVRGLRVLELGCGLALPSIAAARGGARVTATDWSPPALELTAVNAERNGVALETALAAWQEPGALVAGAPWDVVLASDVLYERRNAGLLLDLLPRLVDGSGEVLLTDPERAPAAAFLEPAAARWRLRSEQVAVEPRVTLHRLRPAPTAGVRGDLSASEMPKSPRTPQATLRRLTIAVR